jgi:hypothetical protein
MKESTTYQATLEEGRVEGRISESRRILRRLGALKFGKPSHAIAAQLDKIACRTTLHALIERTQCVASWEELFEKPASQASGANRSRDRTP